MRKPLLSQEDKLAQYIDEMRFYRALLVAYFNKLLEKLSPGLTDSNNNKIMSDLNSIQSLLKAIKKYINVMELSKNNKTNERDHTVFEAQTHNLKSLCALFCATSSNKARELSESDTVSSVTVIQPLPSQCNTISDLFQNACQMQYSLSDTVVGMRRVISFMIFVMATACIAALSCAATTFFMTPGIDYSDPPALFRLNMRAMLAFWHFGNTVYKDYNVNLPDMGMNMPVPIPVPSFMILPFSSLFSGALSAYFLLRKLRITDPVRESAAREFQAAMVDFYCAQLKNKIGEIVTDEIKEELLLTLDKTNQLYRDGVNSWFHGQQSSKMQQALEIFCETAKLVGQATLTELPQEYRALVSETFKSRFSCCNLFSFAQNKEKYTPLHTATLS